MLFDTFIEAQNTIIRELGDMAVSLKLQYQIEDPSGVNDDQWDQTTIAYKTKSVNVKGILIKPAYIQLTDDGRKKVRSEIQIPNKNIAETDSKTKVVYANKIWNIHSDSFDPNSPVRVLILERN